jgi:hypothetical protein
MRASGRDPGANLQRAIEADNAVIGGSCLRRNRLLLEYGDDRSGDFAPLRFAPAENIDQLALSPQCGFASIPPGNFLTEDDQWGKLDLVQEVAGEVW